VATLVQFMRTPKIKPVIVVAGRNEYLTEYGIAEILYQIKGTYLVYNYSGSTPIKSLMTELGVASSFHNTTIHIYHNYQDADDFEFMEWYCENPTKNTVVVLQANSIRRKDGERWVASNTKVQYIDCGNFTEQALEDFCTVSGLTVEQANWLIDYSQGDLDEIVRVLESYSVFAVGSKPDIQLIEPKRIRQSQLSKYYIFDNGLARSAYQALCRTLLQLVIVSNVLPSVHTLMDLAKRVEVDPFIAKRYLGLVKGKSPVLFLDRLVTILQVGDYIKQDMIGAKEYLELMIK